MSDARFSAPMQEVRLSGLLFDMDGTIIDSTKAVEKHWGKIGEEIGVDPAVILATSHGVRSIDVLKRHYPERANWPYVISMEGQIPKLYGDSAIALPGARDLLQNATETGTLWTIVTSGTRPLVTGWLDVLSLPEPKHLVTAESVTEGKPAPDCYILGLENLNLHDSKGSVVVLEDSPAGIRAGKEAGCKVCAVVTSHTIDQIISAKPDWIVQDLSSLRIRDDGPGVDPSNRSALKTTLEIHNGLVY